MIITIANQKGGMGKTTTAITLAAGFARRGIRSLLIDTDSQGSATFGCGIPGEADGKPTIMEVLTGTATVEDAIRKTEDGIDVIPANHRLCDADKMFTDTGKEYMLREALQSLNRNTYKMVIIDTPPILGVLLVNALIAAESVIIPTAAEAFGIHGIAQLKRNLDKITKYFNPNLKILGILLTRTRATRVNMDMIELASRPAKELNTIVYPITIRDAVAIKEAQRDRKSLYFRWADSGAAKDYDIFVEEVLKQVGGGRRHGHKKEA